LNIIVDAGHCIMPSWQPNENHCQYVALPAELSQGKNVNLALANPAQIRIEIGA
jgi:hypothetical protein